MKYNYSIIVPAYNEADAVGPVLAELRTAFPAAEIIVVNDASTDGTAEAVAKHSVTLLTNVQNFGYGYSLKRGIGEAKGEHIIILDADGSYPVAAIRTLMHEYEKGFDMAVGARQGAFYKGSFLKRVARVCFRIISEFATGRTIPDINSGLRIFRKDVAILFFHTLSSGFSFTTTITLAFMLNAYSVTYIPIEYHKRKGNSKVRYVRDTLRSAQIIVEAIATYNPLKIFLLIAAVVFVAGLAASALALWYPWVALFLFLSVAFSMSMFTFGLVVVSLKNRSVNA
ncbi:MAG: glycosyltransferase family 2 protein [Candidatus Parcubacteria bacterium]|nr:glycosyltransferase family 2 protein [Candidatus Parcubacteria bacterium]